MAFGVVTREAGVLFAPFEDTVTVCQETENMQHRYITLLEYYN